MVKLEPPKKGLNPTNYVENKARVRIVPYPETDDCLRVTEETTVDGKRKYNQCNLCILVDNKQKELCYLMEGQLDSLKDQVSLDSKDWINTIIEISGVKNGKFVNWVIEPTTLDAEDAEEVK